MLDVHVPEHKLSGVRDFLVHILTITVGLLIALSLENLVEAIHHRHQREEAETNIRQELQSNRDLLRQAVPTVQAERDSLLKLLTLMQGRANGQPLPAGGNINVTFNERTIADAAWRTASTTGALAYMDYGRVELLADAYKEQDMLQRAEEQALEDYLQFAPVMQTAGANISVEQAKDVIPLVERALGHVNGMLAIGDGTVQAYGKALN
jgi:hypothetical protein